MEAVRPGSLADSDQLISFIPGFQVCSRYIYVTIGALAVAALYYARRTSSPRQKFPPGPRPDPIIDNLRQFPRAAQEKVFKEWEKVFGDVIYLQVLGRSILVLNSVQAARDLLEKKGSLYSDRPRFVAFGELMGWESILTQMPYGDRFKRHRRVIQDHFNRSMVESFRSVHTEEVYKLLDGLLATPHQLQTHIRRFAAGTIMRITYGHNVESIEDQYVKLADEALMASLSYSAPGCAMVDLFPALKHLPEWVPGGFKRRLQAIRARVRTMVETPYEMVKSKMKLGTCPPCFTLSLINDYQAMFNINDPALVEDDIGAIAGVVYGAGSDTIASTIHTFVLAMVMYPEVYKKVQEEMDHVVGSSRMPNVEDIPNLPFFDCVIKEVHRWNPPVPLGIPHQLMTRDDEYCGYSIPKNTMVFANIWGMMHDPTIYPDPERFCPERFLETSDDHSGMYDPRNVIFGFGRRVCPGKLFADQAIFLAASNIAATFDLSANVGDDGRLPSATFAGDTIRHPCPFQCNIEPRSESYRRLVQDGNNETEGV